MMCKRRARSIKQKEWLQLLLDNLLVFRYERSNDKERKDCEGSVKKSKV